MESFRTMIREISPYQVRTISLQEMQKFAGNMELMSLFSRKGALRVNETYVCLRVVLNAKSTAIALSRGEHVKAERIAGSIFKEVRWIDLGDIVDRWTYEIVSKKREPW